MTTLKSNPADGGGGESVASNRATEPHIDALDDIGSDGEHLRVAAITTLSREALGREAIARVMWMNFCPGLAASDEDKKHYLECADAILAALAPPPPNDVPSPSDTTCNHDGVNSENLPGTPSDTRAGGRE